MSNVGITHYQFLIHDLAEVLPIWSYIYSTRQGECSLVNFKGENISHRLPKSCGRFEYIHCARRKYLPAWILLVPCVHVFLSDLPGFFHEYTRMLSPAGCSRRTRPVRVVGGFSSGQWCCLTPCVEIVSSTVEYCDADCDVCMFWGLCLWFYTGWCSPFHVVAKSRV